MSPAGNDLWCGDAQEVGADAFGRPVKSAGAALKKIRFIRDVRNVTEAPAKIVFSKGIHAFTEPLIIESCDSNLTIEGDPAGSTIITSGKRIEGWKKEKDSDFWFAEVRGIKEGAWDFRQLYVNGEMRTRARLPEKGFFDHESSFNQRWMTTSGGGFVPSPTIEQRSTMKYAPGQISEKFSLANAEFIIYHSWDISWTKADSHDPVSRTLHLNPLCTYPPGAFGIRHYAVENIREGMLAPGQWYLDRDEGRVVYWPLKDEDPTLASFDAPVLFSLVQINGTKEDQVSNVKIQNLHLDLTSVDLKPSGFGSPSFDGAVSMKYADHCSLANLTILRAGGQGIKITDSSNIILTDSEVNHIGANGILVHRGRNNIIINNTVYDAGIIYPNSMGINAGYLRNSRIAHNEVSATSYSGIALGNSMKDMEIAQNILEYNRVWNVMNGLDDGGCIYLSGKERKTVVRGNVVSGAHGLTGLAAGLYLDEAVEDVICEDNLISDVQGSVLHSHMTKKNTIRNNIFLCNPGNRISFTRSSLCIFTHNIIFAPREEIRFVDPEGAAFTDNLYFSVIKKTPGEKEVIPIRSDPRFVDPAHNDFRVQDDSPALKMGFKPFDPSRAGLININKNH